MLTIDSDWEWEFIDGSYVKAHQHMRERLVRSLRPFGKSRARNTSKIHLAVDGYGFSVEFEITGGDCSVKTVPGSSSDMTN